MATFTRFMLASVVAFASTWDPSVGQFAFNCSLATAASFESSRLLLREPFERLRDQFARDHACSPGLFDLLDFSVHLLPVLFLLWHRRVWRGAPRPWAIAAASSCFHLGWAALAARDYALDRLYLPEGVTADRASWLQLWSLALLGHFAHALATSPWAAAKS